VAGWLAGAGWWLAGWLAGWLGGWLGGWPASWVVAVPLAVGRPARLADGRPAGQLQRTSGPLRVCISNAQVGGQLGEGWLGGWPAVW
jgi:hypothetical protein